MHWILKILKQSHLQSTTKASTATKKQIRWCNSYQVWTAVVWTAPWPSAIWPYAITTPPATWVQTTTSSHSKKVKTVLFRTNSSLPFKTSTAHGLSKRSTELTLVWVVSSTTWWEWGRGGITKGFIWKERTVLFISKVRQTIDTTGLLWTESDCSEWTVLLDLWWKCGLSCLQGGIDYLLVIVAPFSKLVLFRNILLDKSLNHVLFNIQAKNFHKKDIKAFDN